MAESRRSHRQVLMSRNKEKQQGHREARQIRGRIDRIDYHEATKRWMVFDYKTSDHVKPPEKTHRAEQGWIDLQLPLYRHIVKLLGIHEPVSLGYILLPKETEKTKEYCAKWTDSDLEVADDRIGEVIEAVLAERFWPPTTPAPRYTS